MATYKRNTVSTLLRFHLSYTHTHLFLTCNSQPKANALQPFRRFSSPSHDDEEVQPVPGVSQVTAAAEDPESHHLHHHLQRKEDVDERIEGLKRTQRSSLSDICFRMWRILGPGIKLSAAS